MYGQARTYTQQPRFRESMEVLENRQHFLFSLISEFTVDSPPFQSSTRVLLASQRTSLISKSVWVTLLPQRRGVAQTPKNSHRSL